MTAPRPAYKSRDGRLTLYHAEAFAALGAIAPESVDLVNADPPYSSGGLHKAARAADPRTKYLNNQEGTQYHGFDGDNRDQRSWTRWSMFWMQAALRTMKPGAMAQIWTDWRQLPATTDAMQGAGMTWRGIVPWDKGRGARAPHTGYHRHQCEYVAWGTRGHCPKAQGRGPFPGIVSGRVDSKNKLHPTAKNPDVLAELLVACPVGGVTLDPFMGSGTAGEAALRTGRRFIGIEQDDHHFGVALARLKAVAAETRPTRTRARAA